MTSLPLLHTSFLGPSTSKVPAGVGIPSSTSFLRSTAQQLRHRLFSTTARRVRAAEDKSRSKRDDGSRNQARTTTSRSSPPAAPAGEEKLTHLSASGSAHMVSITDKNVTSRVAKAVCTVTFSDATALRLVRDNQMKKGDVLGVARIAGIMAAKRTSELIPLCHPISLSHVSVELYPGRSQDSSAAGGSGEREGKEGGERELRVEATVTCDGKTGVEMEALTAASTAALTVYDMCKAVDKGMVIGGLRVVLKDGGKSGRWEMP